MPDKNSKIKLNSISAFIVITGYFFLPDIFFTFFPSNLSLNQKIQEDINNISHAPSLKPIWSEISEFKIEYNPPEIIEAIGLNTKNLIPNLNGNLTAELNFISSDKFDKLIILQISIFDKKTKNKLLEFSRSYLK